MMSRLRVCTHRYSPTSAASNTSGVVSRSRARSRRASPRTCVDATSAPASGLAWTFDTGHLPDVQGCFGRSVFSGGACHGALDGGEFDATRQLSVVVDHEGGGRTSAHHLVEGGG